jgi:trimeric autotransporter adhesin
VSVGDAGSERQIVNVADGSEDTDAVNLLQLKALTAALGGGASFNGGVFVAPTYVIQGANYNDVGTAFTAVDGQLTPLAAQYDDASKGVITLEGAAGTRIGNVADGIAHTDAVNKGQLEAGNAATLDSANAYTDTRETAIRTDMDAGDAATLDSANAYTDTRETAIRTDMAAGDAATLDSANGYTDTRETAIRTDMEAGDAATLDHANSYTDTRETAIRGDIESANAVVLESANGYTDTRETVVRTDYQAADAATLATSRTYTDTTATRTLSNANAYTDARFNMLNDDFDAMRGQVESRFTQQDRRIDQMGAMSAAMLNMATSAAGIRTQNRLGVGIGYQNGATALSLGYQRAVSDRTTVTFGGAFSDDESSVGAGIGFGW